MIARATLADTAALFQLELDCFSPAWSEAALFKLLENPAYLVLVARDVNQKARAYLIGWQVGEDAEIARLGVEFGARGQGIAAKLVETALPIWRTSGARHVFLEVRESNAIARHLYAARDFQPVGRRRDYYENGETALILRRSLAAPPTFAP